MSPKAEAAIGISSTSEITTELPIRKKKDMLEMRDCVSCKYLGSMACLAMSAYTVYWSVRKQAEFRGPTRLVYVTTCFGLAGGLGYLGVKRLIDS